MKKLSNKGFTLIELLATILIIGLVLGLTTYGIISSVKSAKDEGSKLTLAGIKEAARTYSNEYTDDTWKASNKSNNIYFCTTIQELINKGLLDKNAKSVEGNSISLNDYIAVVKDKTTKVIKKEFVLRNVYGENALVPVGDSASSLKKIIKVNELGSFIWNNLESAKNEDEIVSLVMDKYQVDFNQAKGDVDDFLKYLRDVDII